VIRTWNKLQTCCILISNFQQYAMVIGDSETQDGAENIRIAKYLTNTVATCFMVSDAFPRII